MVRGLLKGGQHQHALLHLEHRVEVYSLYSVVYGRRCTQPAHLLLREKSDVWRVRTDSIIPSLPVTQWNSFGGSWKWVTILSTLVWMVHLLFTICFCISSYVHQQLHSLDCQNFVHHNSLVIFTYLRKPDRAGFHFWRGPTIFNYLRRQFVKVHAH
jgi:hypothetical protein